MLLLCAAISTASGCGTDDDPGRQRKTEVVLDWTVNPIHAGLLTATERGLDRRNGVSIRLRTPPASSDGVRLLLAGRADFAVLDIHDLAIAADRGRDLVAVMGVTGRPLAAMITAPGISRARQLEGRAVAITGTPSDRAVVRAIVRADGGDPDRVRIAPSGYATTAALVGGRTAAAVGFVNEEGVALRARDPRYRVLRLDRAGVPVYPELVLVTTASRAARDPGLVKAVVESFALGTKSAVSDPNGTLAMLRRKLSGADSKLLAERTRVALASLTPPDGRAGSLDPALMRSWADWEVANGIVASRPDVGRLVVSRFSGR